MTESSRVVVDPELLRLPALFSLLDFLPLREKIDPNSCTLSGLSDRIDGILPEFERPEDLRDKLTLSVEAKVDLRERNEDDADERVHVSVQEMAVHRWQVQENLETTSLPAAEVMGTAGLQERQLAKRENKLDRWGYIFKD
ncbi:hypothetical protein EG329_009495 [Mollisiaceae sp. DMI_Dod_QoI]|nr:hypothetical protein EG329_009495 [Helotiales sp. DMI_Dod_QoI]